MSNVKAFVLLAGMTALFGVVGQALGGQGGMRIALLIAASMSFFMYFNQAKTVLHAYSAACIQGTDTAP